MTAHTVLALTWADYAIIGVIGISTIISLMRGFVREALSLLTWIVAIWVAFKFSSAASNLLSMFGGDYVKSPSIRIAICFGALFVIVLILGALVNYLMSSLITSTGLGGTDRALGMVFGATRGILLVGVFILLGALTSVANNSWWQNSVFIPHFQGIVTWLHSVLPNKIGNINTSIESET